MPRSEWIEARVLEGLQPDQSALETLARQRAQAVQAAILANTDVRPSVCSSRPIAAPPWRPTAAVRMEMKLE